MTFGGHPDLDLLLSVAEGDAAASREARAHLAGCAACRGEVARLRGFLAAVAEELLESRPGCLSTDEIAALPGSAEAHPHLADCPLCREERQALLALEADRQLDLGQGGFVRSTLFERVEGLSKVAAVGALEIELPGGGERRGTAAGVSVRLFVEGTELVVEIDGAPQRALCLLLSNPLLEKRLDLAPGEMRVPIGGWKRASVEERRS